MQNRLARILKGLSEDQHSLIEHDHSRWWQYSIEPPTPIPVNVNYACDKTLGSPSIANCEAALYEFVQSGDVILDPTSGPIIKVTGKPPETCFIVFGAALILRLSRKLCDSSRSERKTLHNMGYATKCCRDIGFNVHK